MLLHDKIYCTEEIITILWPYALKEIVEQLNTLKLDNDGGTPMDKFSGTKNDTTLKNKHTWGCQVYVLDSRN